MSYHLKKIKVNNSSNEVPSVGKDLSAPSFYMSAEQMPEIKDWEVGKKYQLIIEVEQISKNEHENSVHASFEIVAYKHIPKKSIDEMTDEEFGEYQNQSVNKGELA